MKISHRAQTVEPFYAMVFGQHAAALEAAGNSVVKLSLGEPDFGAPPAVREAMRNVMNGQPLPYTHARGLPELRAALSRFYKEFHDVDVDPSRIVITSGASSALLLVIAATVESGDEVIMADPSYPCNRHLVESFGGRVRTIPTDADTKFQLHTAAVERAWSESTGAVMIATPSNPTGTSISESELANICKLARDRGAWRIVDEIYLNLSDPSPDGAKPRSVLSTDPTAIVINSFSKYFGMTGWRLGWCVLPETLVSVVERLATNYFLCASAPAQLAALACFTPESLAICEDRRRELAARRRLLIDGLKHIGLPVAVVPDGAFYIYVNVADTGLSSWDFCERALHEAHVAITPGKDFGVHTADTHVRLSYAASREELAEGIVRLGSFLRTVGKSALAPQPDAP